MRATTKTLPTKEAGFSALETAISIAVFSIATVIFGSSFQSSVDTTESVVSRSALQEVGRDALFKMTQELARSGYATDDAGVSYPLIFGPGLIDDEVPTEFLQFASHMDAHVLAIADDYEATATVNSAVAGLAGRLARADATNVANLDDGLGVDDGDMTGVLVNRGLIRQLIYRVPSDRDGDGTVFSTLDGTLEWSEALYGFILIPDGKGTFDLVRRRLMPDGAIDDHFICHHVVSMTFNSRETNNLLSRDALEIHLRLKRQDVAEGDRRLHTVSTTILMRNSNS